MLAARVWMVGGLCVRGIGHTRALMWHHILGLLRVCRKGEGYLAPGTEDHDNRDHDERDHGDGGHGDGGKDAVSSQPMGSERMEMRKRQMAQQDPNQSQGNQSQGNQSQGNQSQGNQSQGNQSQGNQSQGNQSQGNQSQGNQSQGNQSQGNQRGNNACCFCWCCCCSCSWKEEHEGRNLQASYDLKADGTADCKDRPPPTLDEVRSWAQSFDRLMSCSAGRVAFRLFLCTEFSEENMLFWLACEDFTKETNKTSIEEKARVIYEDYISILSPKEVSLDSHVREVINKNMLEPSTQTFVDAQVQIYTLMQRDSYPRYMNSPAYKNLLISFSEQATPES